MSSHLKGLAARRHRITLMAEAKSQGAGGRFVTTTPIIADVWASVDEEGGALTERAAHEFLPARVRFTCQYCAPYQQARRILWRGATYRITSQQAEAFGALPSLNFDAVLMEGNQP
jgi:head-tail adaptor